MQLRFSDNAAAVADPQVKLGVEKGIAVSSGLGEENAGMVEATLSLTASRRLGAATRQLSGLVRVDFQIDVPAEDSTSIDAGAVAESLASADEGGLASALSAAIASVAGVGYSVEVSELPSVVAPAASAVEPPPETESSSSLLKVAAVVIGVVVIGGWLTALGVVHFRRRAARGAKRGPWSGATREPSRELSREFSI